jgi:hypothetical protein
MLKEEITIAFNLENEPDNKIYYVLKNLTKYYKEFLGKDNLSESEAIIRYISDVSDSLYECSERKERCERMLELYLGKRTQH